jgi:hypothetical protein
MRDYIKALNEEVAFWKKMLQECEAGKDSIEYKRILDGLSFARYKLIRQRVEHGDKVDITIH